MQASLVLRMVERALTHKSVPKDSMCANHSCQDGIEEEFPLDAELAARIMSLKSLIELYTSRTAEEEVLDTLQRLEALGPFSADMLHATKVEKSVNALLKRTQSGTVRASARASLSEWKDTLRRNSRAGLPAAPVAVAVLKDDPARTPTECHTTCADANEDGLLQSSEQDLRAEPSEDTFLHTAEQDPRVQALLAAGDESDATSSDAEEEGALQPEEKAMKSAPAAEPVSQNAYVQEQSQAEAAIVAQPASKDEDVEVQPEAKTLISKPATEPASKSEASVRDFLRSCAKPSPRSARPPVESTVADTHDLALGNSLQEAAAAEVHSTKSTYETDAPLAKESSLPVRSSDAKRKDSAPVSSLQEESSAEAHCIKSMPKRDGPLPKVAKLLVMGPTAKDKDKDLTSATPLQATRQDFIRPAPVQQEPAAETCSMKSTAETQAPLAKVARLPVKTSLADLSDAAALAGPFVTGQRVVFRGLVGRADLNGCYGTLNRWDSTSGRWAVALSGGLAANVRPANMLAAPTDAQSLRTNPGPLSRQPDVRPDQVHSATSTPASLTPIAKVAKLAVKSSVCNKKAPVFLTPKPASPASETHCAKSSAEKGPPPSKVPKRRVGTSAGSAGLQDDGMDLQDYISQQGEALTGFAQSRDKVIRKGKQDLQDYINQQGEALTGFAQSRHKVIHLGKDRSSMATAVPQAHIPVADASSPAPKPIHPLNKKSTPAKTTAACPISSPQSAAKAAQTQIVPFVRRRLVGKQPPVMSVAIEVYCGRRLRGKQALPVVPERKTISVRGHYDVLGVLRTASAAEIHAAYRRRALATHPDKGGDPKDFRRVKLAFEELVDKTRRAAYDRNLSFFGRKDGMNPEAQAADSKQTTSAPQKEAADRQYHGAARVAYFNLLTDSAPAWSVSLAQMADGVLKKLWDILKGCKSLSAPFDAGDGVGANGVLQGWQGPTCITKHATKGYKVEVRWADLSVCTSFTKSLTQSIDWQIALLNMQSAAQLRMKRRECSESKDPLIESEVLQVLETEPGLGLTFTVKVGDGRKQISAPGVMDLQLAMDFRDKLQVAARGNNSVAALKAAKRSADQEATKEKKKRSKRLQQLLVAVSQELQTRRAGQSCGAGRHSSTALVLHQPNRQQNVTASAKEAKAATQKRLPIKDLPRKTCQSKVSRKRKVEG